jgi:hypothetical protein
MFFLTPVHHSMIRYFGGSPAPLSVPIDTPPPPPDPLTVDPDDIKPRKQRTTRRDLRIDPRGNNPSLNVITPNQTGLSIPI